MKRTLFSMMAILCASFVFFSCSKDNNTPVTDNSQALTSTFNVKSSDWSSTTGGYFVSYNLSELTQSINESGAVWIYYSFDNGGTYELAPSLSRTDKNGNIFDFLGESGYDNDGGYVTLTALSYTGNTSTAPNFNGNLSIKVVSIPSSLYNANQNVNKEDYNSVKRTFNLK